MRFLARTARSDAVDSVMEEKLLSDDKLYLDVVLCMRKQVAEHSGEEVYQPR